mmetsp:Transcript_85980/g.271065  ORF Transcript_85980/g.271065 Transcript_85980/m.271065 type:complete len:379 (+) Transcript_85980:52-1188(+)
MSVLRHGPALKSSLAFLSGGRRTGARTGRAPPPAEGALGCWRVAGGPIALRCCAPPCLLLLLLLLPQLLLCLAKLLLRLSPLLLLLLLLLCLLLHSLPPPPLRAAFIDATPLRLSSALVPCLLLRRLLLDLGLNLRALFLRADPGTAAAAAALKLALHLQLHLRSGHGALRLRALEGADRAKRLRLDLLELGCSVGREADALDRRVARGDGDHLLVAGRDLLAVLVGHHLLLGPQGLAPLLVAGPVVLSPQQVLHLVLRELALGEEQLLGLETQRLLHQLLLVGLHRIALGVDGLRRLALLRVPVVHVVAGKLGHHPHLRRRAQVTFAVLELLLLDGVPLEVFRATAAPIADPDFERIHGWRALKDSGKMGAGAQMQS